MDPISQGVLGAIVAGSVAPRGRLRLATLIGGCAGMLADLDVLIRSEADPLLSIEYHRHFSHSLFFIPIGGAIAAFAFWLLNRRREPFRELYLYATLGYATAGLLDACTSYGTRLLWPFSEARIAWSVISIIDPVFTGTILLLLIWATSRRRVLACRLAVGFACAYLLFGFVQNRRATAALQVLAAERGHVEASSFTAKPSIGNLAVWRGIYLYDDFYYIDAIRVSYLSGAVEVYPGDRVPALEVESLLSEQPVDSVLRADVLRFEHFSDGYLIRHPERLSVVGDARYAMLPNSTLPLWGIEFDLSQPDAHAPFHTFRQTDRSEFRHLWSMIRGDQQ